MTKNEMIYGVLGVVNGGFTSNDSSRKVSYDEVSNKLSGAINYVIMQHHFLAIKDENIREFPSDFYATYTVDVLYDAVASKHYAELPFRLFSVYKNRGIRAVTTLSGSHYLIQTSVEEQMHNSYYSGSFAADAQYYLSGKRLWLVNLPETVTKLNVIVLIPYNDIGEDDELPLPAGTENEVMDYLIKMFSVQRQTPSDNTNNNIQQPFNIS